jgi:hypothetical protein
MVSLFAPNDLRAATDSKFRWTLSSFVRYLFWMADWVTRKPQRHPLHQLPAGVAYSSTVSRHLRIACAAAP